MKSCVSCSESVLLVVSVSVYVACCSLKQVVCHRMMSGKRVGPDGPVRPVRMGISGGGGLCFS
jgi:hypothetical protein